MNVIVDNRLVHYSRQGKGKAVLLLHGWGDRLETFDSLAESLEADFEIIRLDLAGFGSSQAPDSAWGLEEYAGQVQSFLQKINVKPYMVLGHSNGGAVAIKGMKLGLLVPKKLVLLSSAGVRSTELGRKTVWKLVAKAGKLSTAALPDHAKKSLRARLYGSIGSDLLVAPHMEKTFKRIVSQDVVHDARSISIPTLIVNGTKDDATPVEFARKFHDAISHSELVLIDGADHFAHQRVPQIVSGHIRTFLTT